ncbi:MAG: diguanylate cyclase [Methylotetracoccus sp.]
MSDNGRRIHADERLIPHSVTDRESFLLSIINSCSDAILLVDQAGLISFANPEAGRLFGKPAAELIGGEFGFPILLNKHQEIDVLCSPGNSLVAELVVRPLDLEGSLYFVASLRDITTLVRYREELRTQSLLDDVTELFNRRAFLNLAEQQLKMTDRRRAGLTLFFIDMDDFKSINDTHGHAWGDRALKDTARIFKSIVRASDIVARMGGDEFAVLAIDMPRGAAAAFQSRLQHSIDAYNQEQKSPFRLSASIGSAYFDPETPSTLDELLASADRAMYEAKRAQRAKLPV